MTDVYVFAVTQNGLVSYPDDQTHEYFGYAIKMSKNNAQIVLVRRDNLLHYCYVRKIKDKQFFGLCLRIDCIYKDTEDLFRAFDAAYTNLIKDGVFLQMLDDTSIAIHDTNLAKESVALAELSNKLLHALAISNKTTLPLPPADFSKSINDCKDLSFEDSTNVEIIRSIQQYSNVYIVKTHDEIARITEFAKLIKKLKEEILRLNDTIKQLEDKVSELKKQKNKYRWVLLLLGIIFIGAIIFFNVMQSKNDSIYELEQENYELWMHVESLQKDSSTLSTQLINTKKNLSISNKKLYADSIIIDSISKENRLQNIQINELLEIAENYRDKITKLEQQLSSIPIHIEISNQNDDSSIDIPYGNRIDADKSKFLGVRFDCYTNKIQEFDFVLKLYYPNGKLICNNDNGKKGYTEKKSFSLKQGKNTCAFTGWGGKNKGHYSAGQYRCEIWANDIKIGEKKFTLY